MNPTLTDFGASAFEVGPVTSDERCLGVHILVDHLRLTYHLAS